MTLVGCVNAAADAISAYLIFKRHALEEYGELLRDTGIRIARTETGFSSRENTLDWLRHFNRQSFEKHAEVQRRGLSFEEWFGCDEHGIDQSTGETVEPRQQECRDDRIYRMLIVDSFAGHHGLDIYEYCQRFNIVLVFLPPHSSHFLQPLDVGVFQWLKRAHKNRLKELVRDGQLVLTRRDFIELLQDILDQAFRRHYILNGWINSGLWPFDRTIVIEKLRGQQHAETEALYPEMAPNLTRVRSAKKAMKRVRRLQDILSSPTRQDLRHLDSVLNEGILAMEQTKKFAADREKRLRKLHKKLSRHIVKPSGLFMNSVSVQELQQLSLERKKKEADEALASQRRTWLKMASIELKELKKTYNEEKKDMAKVMGNRGKMRMVNFAEWYHAVGKTDDFIPLDDDHPLAKELRKYDTPTHAEDSQLFWYDTQRSSGYMEPTMPSFEANPGANRPLRMAQRIRTPTPEPNLDGHTMQLSDFDGFDDSDDHDSSDSNGSTSDITLSGFEEVFDRVLEP